MHLPFGSLASLPYLLPPLQEKLVDALVAAKHANVGLLTCRQLFFGMFDQTIHSQEKSDTAAILADLHIKVTKLTKETP